MISDMIPVRIDAMTSVPIMLPAFLTINLKLVASLFS